MKKFLNAEKVQLVNGYVSNGPEMAPVTHEAFIAAQKRAEYVCTFAELAKGKDFKGKEADSLEDLKTKVAERLTAKATEFVPAPAKVSQELTEKLKAEANAFMSFTDETSKVEKINKFLQEFNILKEFEEVGLFFEDGIVKLNKIYTLKDVVAAVKSVIDLLD